MMVMLVGVEITLYVLIDRLTYCIREKLAKGGRKM